MKTIMYAMVFIAMIFSNDVQGQDFKSAVGLRLGYPLSVTYKTFISETNALEGYVGYRGFGGASFIAANAAYLIHQDIEGEMDNLQWYYGAGAGAYFWSVDFGGGSSTTLGVSGYIGASYTLQENPINISIDWVPTFFINGLDGFGTGFGGGYGSLAVRYILGTDQ